MTDQRRLKTIATRYDLEVDRHPDAWRQLRWRLSIVFAIGTIAATIPMLLGDHRVFESRCASDAHRIFGQNCQACHDRQMVPLMRMATLDNTRHSTSDHKCQVCHRETNSDHVARVIPANLTTALAKAAITPQDASSKQTLEQLLRPKFDAIGCAGCHQEHRGNFVLAHVADANCTDCHQTPHQIPRRFQLDFANFGKHPEFAIWRPQSETPDKPLVTLNEKGKPVDQAAIRFSHHRHLDPQLNIRVGQTTSLECSNCHQADASGSYFRPINFEQHCSRCHKLGLPQTDELPHVEPEIIRKTLLDRLVRNRTRPQLPAATDQLGGPTKPPIVSRDQGKNADLANVVNVELAELEQQLFNAPPAIARQAQEQGLLKTACNKCHYTQPAADSSWRITPTRIPEQWMSNSRFRHDRHSSIDCGLCHTRHGGHFESVERVRFYSLPKLDLEKSPSIFASTSAQDVLLPRIDVCRQCHGQNSTQGATSVTDRCVDCHSYHHTPITTVARPGIEQLLKTGRPPADEPAARPEPEAGR